MFNNVKRPIIKNGTRGLPRIVDIWAIDKSNFVIFFGFQRAITLSRFNIFKIASHCG